MFFEEPRTDGLLRGPRAERTEWITALADAPWDLETLLELHLGLLDHAQDVRVAAMEALRSIARRKPHAIAVTAVELLRKVDLAKLSRTRRNMISRVLERESGPATA